MRTAQYHQAKDFTWDTLLSLRALPRLTDCSKARRWAIIHEVGVSHVFKSFKDNFREGNAPNASQSCLMQTEILFLAS